MAEPGIRYKRGAFPQLATSLPQAFARELDKIALALAEVVKLLEEHKALLDDHETRITTLEP